MSDCNELVANKDMDEILHVSVHRDNVAAVHQAIQSGANVNAVHRDRDRGRITTPLSIACKRGANDVIVHALLDAGADPRWNPCPYST